MSASEKLKALGKLRLAERVEILDALPQIVAVVEAAELHLDLHDPRSRQNTAPLTTALAALDEALT